LNALLASIYLNISDAIRWLSANLSGLSLRNDYILRADY